MSRWSLFVVLFGVLCWFGQSIEASMNNEPRVLVLFNSTNEGTYKLAKAIASGVEDFSDAVAVLKQIPRIKPLKDGKKRDYETVSEARIEELPTYDGIAFGSPVHFGNMSADMRYFLDQSVPLWTERKLEGIPATVFMSAGSGAGREAAILSFWNTLALHGMIIVPTGMMGANEINKVIPQGNTPFGTTSLAGMPPGDRPSVGELHLARLQGYALAKLAKGALTVRSHQAQDSTMKKNRLPATGSLDLIEQRLKELGIELPQAPLPVGNYKPYSRAGNLIYINQVALKNGRIERAGLIGEEVSESEARAATRQTLLNVLAVLKEASGGNLNRVKQVVQLTGFFLTKAGYQNHASLMNEASDLVASIFGEKGKHARATIGASSLPLGSPVEIQAIFELEF